MPLAGLIISLFFRRLKAEREGYMWNKGAKSSPITPHLALWGNFEKRVTHIFREQREYQELVQLSKVNGDRISCGMANDTSYCRMHGICRCPRQCYVDALVNAITRSPRKGSPTMINLVCMYNVTRRSQLCELPTYPKPNNPKLS
jgi:hypothetical protein